MKIFKKINSSNISKKSTNEMDIDYEKEKLKDLKIKISEINDYYERITYLVHERERQLKIIEKELVSKRIELKELESRIYNWKNSESSMMKEDLVSNNIKNLSIELEMLQREINKKYKELEKLNKVPTL